MEKRKRIIQESVPGKQITIAHVIANPDPVIFDRINVIPENKESIGVLYVTPREAAVIAADACRKAAGIEIGFMDRFSGAIVIMGDVSAVEAALEASVDALSTILGFKKVPITRT